MRLSASGSVDIENVRVPWDDALGWDPETKRPLPHILGVPFASLLLPTIQLVFSNFYIGVAQGALDFGAKYTVSQTRAWPYGGDNKDTPLEEFYILERYGGYHAHLLAAAALADGAGKKVADLYAKHQPKRSVSARERGEVAEAVAAVKVVATDTGLDVTNGVFEVTGARATSRKVGIHCSATTYHFSTDILFTGWPRSLLEEHSDPFASRSGGLQETGARKICVARRGA